MLARVRTSLARLAAERSGSFVVEFAVALPILTLLVLGLVDLGRYSLQKSALLQGAREGAQYGSFAPNNTTDINSTAQNATGLAGVTASTRVFCECTFDVPKIDCSPCSGGATLKKYVEVTTTKSFSPTLSVPALAGLGTSTSATVTMICP